MPTTSSVLVLMKYIAAIITSAELPCLEGIANVLKVEFFISVHILVNSITGYGSTTIAMVCVFSPYIRKFSSYSEFQVILAMRCMYKDVALLYICKIMSYDWIAPLCICIHTMWL